MYQITNYTKQKAKELNVKIKPSSNPKKKIDVYEDNKKVASVGAIGYDDYPTYIIKKGKSYADERRKLYRVNQILMNDISATKFQLEKLEWNTEKDTRILRDGDLLEFH
jgi:hypothetical protein